MAECKSIANDYFRNAALCEWYVQKTGRTPSDLDTGETYVDLKNPHKPQTQKEEPDGEISPRELHAAVTQLLEQEWRQVFARSTFLFQDVKQPIAEELYDRFQYAPPWLPKPFSRMSPYEKTLLSEFVANVRKKEQVNVIKNAGIRDNYQEAIIEDNLLEILKAGVAGCVGISNLSYFAQAIVKRSNANFIDIYKNNVGAEQDHRGIAMDGKPNEPAQFWFYLHPMDQWATSLMNTGIARAKNGEIDAPTYMLTYGLRAYELAPNYFRVLFALGEDFYEGGQRKLGIYFLQGVAELYPANPELEKWKKIIRSERSRHR